MEELQVVDVVQESQGKREHLSFMEFTGRCLIFTGLLTASGLIVANYLAEKSEATLTTQGEGVRQEVIK